MTTQAIPFMCKFTPKALEMGRLSAWDFCRDLGGSVARDMTHCCVITDVTFTTDLQRKNIVMFYRIVQDLHPCLDGAHLCGNAPVRLCAVLQYACEISWMQLGGKPIVVITRGL